MNKVKTTTARPKRSDPRNRRIRAVHLAMNWGPLFILLILPVEIMLVTVCPAIQIFGPNPLREWIAAHLPTGLGHHAYHLAGAMTDFKKLLIYTVCASQMFFIRALIRCHTNRDERRFFRIRLSLSEIELLVGSFRSKAKRARAAGAAVAVLWTVYFLFQFVRVFIAPSMTDHVFGPVGKGLISAFTNSSLDWSERMPLVAYRAWYLFATLLTAGLTVFSALPSIVLAATYRPRKEELSNGPPPQTLPPVLLMFIGVPVLALMGIATLWAATELLGIGELGGRSFEGAIVALVTLAIWTVLGFIMGWRFKELPGPFNQLCSMIRRVAFAAGLCALILVPAGWISDGAIRATITTAVLRCETINRTTEFEGWRIDKARPLLASVRTDVVQIVESLKISDPAARQRMAASIFNRDNDFLEHVAKKLDTDDDLVDLLVSSVMLNAMLRCAPISRNAQSIDPYQTSVDRISAKLDQSLANPNAVGPIPWTRDADFLHRYRIQSLRDFLRACAKRRFEVIDPACVDAAVRSASSMASQPSQSGGAYLRMIADATGRLNP